MNLAEERTEIEVLNGVFIDSAEIVKKSLSVKLKMDFADSDFEQMLEFIRSENGTYCFLDGELCQCESEAVYEMRYAWIDTGCVDLTGEHLYISTIKYPGYYSYSGHVVGDAKFLASILASKNIKKKQAIYGNLSKLRLFFDENREKRTDKDIMDTLKERMFYIVKNGDEIIEQAASNIQALTMQTHEKEYTPVTEEIFSNLMFPSWKSIDGLDRYLKVIGTRLLQLISREEKAFYVDNGLAGFAVNSALVDRFGNDYIILYKRFYKEGVYDYFKAQRILSSKNDFLEEGFTREQATMTIRPISFFDKGEEYLDISVDDIDITPRNLTHIIEERRNRFPENVREQAAITLAQKITEAIKMDIKMVMRDRTYAKPIYSSKVKHVAWVLPLYIDKSITEEPEMAIIVDKAGEFYEVKTVLEYNDDLKDKITALNLYGKVW